MSTLKTIKTLVDILLITFITVLLYNWLQFSVAATDTECLLSYEHLENTIIALGVIGVLKVVIVIIERLIKY